MLTCSCCVKCSGPNYFAQWKLEYTRDKILLLHQAQFFFSIKHVPLLLSYAVVYFSCFVSLSLVKFFGLAGDWSAIAGSRMVGLPFVVA